jgi:hypothetical protein
MRGLRAGAFDGGGSVDLEHMLFLGSYPRTGVWLPNAAQDLHDMMPFRAEDSDQRDASEVQG